MSDGAFCMTACLLSFPCCQSAASVCQTGSEHPLSRPARPLQAAQAAQQKVWTHDDVFQLFYAIFEHVQQPPHLLPLLASPRIAGKGTAEASCHLHSLLSRASGAAVQYSLLLKLLFLGLIDGGR